MTKLPHDDNQAGPSGGSRLSHHHPVSSADRGGGDGDPYSFPAQLLALSTLQIIASTTDFTSVRPMALSILTHVASRYLELLGEAARANADHCSRTQINGWDISGVLESLQGPGALSGLYNWCREHADRRHPQADNRSRQSFRSGPEEQIKEQTTSDEVDKLARISRHLTEFRSRSPPPPIAALSFLPLTDAEVAELDRAGESDLEDDHPSPLCSLSSGSSEDDSDLEMMPPAEVRPMSSLSPENILRSALIDQGSEVERMQIDESTLEPALPTHSWRSTEDIPSYVPSHLPPFPGLERISSPPPARVDQNGPEQVITQEAPREQTPPSERLSDTQDPYTFAVPYSQSQLREFHGDFVAPQRPLSPGSPPSSNKKPKMSGPLEGFLETYRYLMEENSINKFTDEEGYLRRNPARKQVISTQQTEPMHTSMFGSIPISSIRTNRWSAGWIPHPPTKDGKLLPIPELKPFSHSPLPLPVTMPVPIQFPPNPLINQPHARIPSLVPTLFQQITQEARHETFTLINRMTRLAPPSELGEAGEPLSYRIKETNETMGSGGNTQENEEANLNRPKYLNWGFHWPPHDGRETILVPRLSSLSSLNDFKPQEFPGMPKTTAEKAKIAREEAEANAKALNEHNQQMIGIQDDS